MSLDKIAEELIRKAQEQGQFDNLPGRGKPIDLSEYFETPEEVRVAQSVLKNAGFQSREVELLNEIVRLRQLKAAVQDEQKQKALARQIQEKQVEFSLRMERRRRK